MYAEGWIKMTSQSVEMRSKFKDLKFIYCVYAYIANHITVCLLYYLLAW